MSDKLLALILLSSFSGDSYFSFIWGLFLCLPILVVTLCLFLCIRLICFDTLSVEWPCILGILWDPVVQTPLSPDLDALGMSSVWVMWTLLLCFSPDYYCPVHWWELSSFWLAKKLNPHNILHVVCCCIGVHRTKQNNTQYQNKQTHLTTTAIWITKKQRTITVVSAM